MRKNSLNEKALIKMLEIRRNETNWTDIAKYIEEETGEKWHSDTIRKGFLVADWLDKAGLINKASNDIEKQGSIEYNKDGTVTKDKLIEICEGEEMTPEFMLKAHGLDIKTWKVISYRNNYWHSQIKGGKRLLMYQSRINVKPYADNEISLQELKEWFTDFEKTYKPPKVNYIKQEANQMLEVDIADLHLGKLAWHGETGEDYDYKIASERYKYAIDDICSRVNKKRIEKIVLPLGNDFFNSDTPDGETTKGTLQNNDIRPKKMFPKGLELMIYGIDTLSKIAPIESFNVEANHDEMTSYYALFAIKEHFRNYKNVDVVISAEPRYYVEYYNTLIGFCHGADERKRIHQLMQNEAQAAWGRTKFHEFHAGHIHCETASEEGGIIFRTLSSLTGTDAYHKKAAFIGAVKKSQSFLYDREKGLIAILNSVV